MKKRRHHTVWQYYLKPWTRHGKIACLQNGATFFPGTTNVAVETDFYRLKDLTARDIAFLESFIARSPEAYREAHRDWLESVLAATQAQQSYELGLERDPAVANAIDELIANLEEDLHTAIETSASRILDELRREERAFFAGRDSYADFVLFLCTQYVRTSVVQQSVCNAFLEDDWNMEAAWPVLRHFCAVNVAGTFVARRADVQLTILRCPTEMSLVTGDQPVINTYAIEHEEPEQLDHLRFYYPISPSSAILLGTTQDRSDAPETLVLTHDDVRYYNRAIARAAHRQVYALGEEIFPSLAVEPKRDA